MKTVFGFAGGGVLLLSVLIFVRTLQFTHQPVAVAPAPPLSVDTSAVAERLAGGLQIPTITQDDPARLDSSAFRAFHAYLERHFPRVHTTLKKETVSDLSLLYTWPGRDTTLQPVLLMAHQDVVPVEKRAWTRPPFDGTITDGHVWGRGALDNKGPLLAILEAVDMLLRDRFQPRRTVYLAFGHDEEVGGRRGAVQLAATLASRSVELAYVLDEGGVVAEDVVPGVEEPVAVVGIAEKGYLSLELVAEGTGGHASAPPEHTSVGIISQAIVRLERNRPDARLGPSVQQFFEHVGPKMAFAQRLVFANLWLTRPLVRSMLGDSPITDAAIRTTTAATMVRGSQKDNVLPTQARAVVNFRLLPGDTIEDVVAHARETVNDPRVTIRPIPSSASEPSPVSDAASPSYRTLERTIYQTVPAPDLVVAPYLVMGATDARHYEDVADQIYRFAPFTLGLDDRARLHGPDERIAIRDYVTMMRFYYQLLKNSQALDAL